MSWREAVPKKICATMRYCFRNFQDGQFPDIIEDEWYGTDDTSGAKDYIVSLLFDEVKRAYKAGYVQAYEADCDDLEQGLVEAKANAERAFNEWDKNE